MNYKKEFDEFHRKCLISTFTFVTSLIVALIGLALNADGNIIGKPIAVIGAIAFIIGFAMSSYYSSRRDIAEMEWGFQPVETRNDDEK